GGHPGSARQAHEHGVEIAALPAEVARLQHAFDVAPAAAFHFGITESVFYDPFVDRARLLDIRLRALGNVARRIAHDTGGRNPLGRLQVELEHGRIFLRPAAGLGGIDHPIPRGKTARYFYDG